MPIRNGPPRRPTSTASPARRGRPNRLSLVSPAGVFRAIASAVCRTDLASHARRMDRTRRYRETFVRWLQGKDIFGSFTLDHADRPGDVQDRGRARREADGRGIQDGREYEAWASKQKDARARWIKLSTVKLHGDSPDDFPFLDISDMPRFQDQAGSLLSGLESSVPKAGLLLVAAVFLFALGYVAFIRFDVR